MKKVLLVLLVLILAAGGGFVFLVVRSLNVESFQSQIAQSVRDATGREMAVKGGAQMRWLPMPTFELKQIAISNQPNSPRPEMLTAERMLVQIDWKSLFQMPVAIRQVELENPALYLERLETNKANFDLPFLKGRTALDGGGLIKGGEGFGLKFESIKIIDGSVHYVNKISGAESRIDAIKGVLKLESILGPLQFQGGAQVQGYPMELDVKMKAYRPLEATDFAIKASDKTAGVVLNFDGTLDNNRPRQWLSGGGSFEVDKPAEIARLFKEDMPGQLDAKLVGSFSASLSASGWEVKDLVLVRADDKSVGFNASAAQDIVQGRPSPLRIALKMVRANADDFQRYWDKLDWSVLSQGGARPVDLTAEAQEVLYRQTKLADVRAQVSLNSRGLTLTDVSGKIGADTTFKFSGAAEKTQETPRLTLAYDIAGPDAAAVLKLAPDIGIGVPPNQAIAVKGTAVVTPQKTDLTFQQARIGSGELKGVVTRHVSPARWDVQATLSQVNVDAYTGWKAPAQKQSAEQAFGQIKAALTSDKRWAEYQSDFDITLKDVTIRGVQIPSGQAKGSLDKGVLAISAASVSDVATTTLRLGGTIAGLGTPDIKLADVSGTLQSKQPSALFDKLMIDVPAPWAKRPNAVLNAKVSGAAAAWSFDVSGIVSDAVFKLAGGYADGMAKDVAFDITHPNVQEFVRLWGGASASVGAYDGVFKASGVFSGNADKMAIQKADVKLGAQQFKGDAAIQRGAVVQADAVVSTPVLDVQRLVSLFGPDPLKGLSVLDNWQAKVQLTADKVAYGASAVNAAKGELAVQDKTLTLRQFSGVFPNKGSVSAAGSLTWGAKPVAQIQGDIRSYALAPDAFMWDELMLGGGALSLSGSLTAAGETFEKMKSTAKGGGRADISDALLVGMDAGRAAEAVGKTIRDRGAAADLEKQIEQAFTSGRTPVTRLSGDWTMDQGVLRLPNASLDMPAAHAAPVSIMFNTLTSAVGITAPIVLSDWKKLPPMVLGIASDDKGAATRTAKVSDFVQAAAQAVKAGQEEDEARKRAEQKKAEQEKVAEQAKIIAEKEQLAQKTQEEIRAAIAQVAPMANDVLKVARQMIAENPSDAGGMLLQTVQDAVDTMNRLHVKPTLTPEEERQIVEQGQLAILKAKELMDVVTGELIADLRKKIGDYMRQGRDGVIEIQAIRRARPDIEQMATLAEYAEQRMLALESLNELLQPSMTLEQ
ncbi:MAG: AsmA family protein, partial [Alphaproteobacteria bacterium]|nr:AsmA family protein [Alphaproteobacteria bacterium]